MLRHRALPSCLSCSSRRPYRHLVSPALLSLWLTTLALPAAYAADRAADRAADPGARTTAKATAGKAPTAKEEEASLQALRERLAEKLGAIKPTGARPSGLVRISAQIGIEDAAAKPTTAAAAAAAITTAKVRAAAQATKPGTKLPAGEHALHWSYQGELGPKAWGGIRPDFIKCAVGSRQSPIDIRSGIVVDLEPIQFDYRASAFRVVDNGHTVQVNIDPGNAIVIAGRRWDLVQFHFHRPGEERVDGKTFEMSLHLVHKDADGRLAVVGLLLERGIAQPVVQSVWNNLPLEKGDEVSTRAVLDLNHLLPPDRGYYTYMGSLTTPPCTEGVLWMVMRQPVPLSAEQIDIFARLYPMNARPVQQASGRMIKQSN